MKAMRRILRAVFVAALAVAPGAWAATLHPSTLSDSGTTNDCTMADASCSLRDAPCDFWRVTQRGAAVARCFLIEPNPVRSGDIQSHDWPHSGIAGQRGEWSARRTRRKLRTLRKTTHSP
jgi:hypothetical protein